MALVFSCIASHTPLLMPTIGKDVLATSLAKTVAAMKQLEQELYTTHPETLIVITPHGSQLPDAVTVNLNSSYRTDFKEFGDLTTDVRWKPNTMLIDRIREDFKEKHLPLVLDSAPSLDYGSAVPLWYLTQHLPDVKIVPIVTSGLDMEKHFELGKQLKDEIMSATERIAVIASADLSHTLTKDAPGGFSQRGVDLDAKIKGMIESGDCGGMHEIDEAWVREAQACGAKVLAVLYGILDGVQCNTNVLSYEYPFGVGYLVAEMKNG